MGEQLKYVSPEYQARLDRLAETLVTQRRFGEIAVSETVDQQLVLELDKARWLRQLDDARRLGGVATFNFEYSEPAKIIAFPTPEDSTPDGAA